MAFLCGFQEPINRITWFTTWNYSLRNHYSDDIDYIPQTTGSYRNSNIKIFAKKPCIATVDYGDGIVEQHPFVKSAGGGAVGGGGYYILIFRSLNYQHYNQKYAHWFNTEDGSTYVPVAPHHYADDDTTIQRHVTVTFSSDIDTVVMDTPKMTSFPVLEIPALRVLDLHDTYSIQSIPYDSLSRVDKLESLVLSNLGGTHLPVIPDSILNKTNLVLLNVQGCFDLTDIDSSGLRKINNLKNLKELNVGRCKLTKYIREFNDLSKITKLSMNPGYNMTGVNSLPDMSEVDQINQNLDQWSIMTGWMNTEKRTEWPTQISGKGLGNLTQFDASTNGKISTDFPDFFYEMRSLSLLYIYRCFSTKERTDAFIGSFYDKVVNWKHITMGNTAVDGQRNQFYGLDIRMYDTAYPNDDVRPSGTLQAPEGFVKGQSNGDPQTPLEKIYVLTNNYNQKWTIRPE